MGHGQSTHRLTRIGKILRKRSMKLQPQWTRPLVRHSGLQRLSDVSEPLSIRISCLTGTASCASINQVTQKQFLCGHRWGLVAHLLSKTNRQGQFSEPHCFWLAAGRFTAFSLLGVPLVPLVAMQDTPQIPFGGRPLAGQKIEHKILHPCVQVQSPFEASARQASGVKPGFLNTPKDPIAESLHSGLTRMVEIRMCHVSASGPQK